MIKVFTTNKNGKIELTKDELKNLLDEAYWEGYKANNHIYTYKTPNWSPWTVTCSNGATNFTLNTMDADVIKNCTITCDSTVEINVGE